MKKLLLFAILVTSVVATTGAQDILNLRMDRDQLGLRGKVSAVDEDLLVRKDYFREDWPTRKWFRTDLRQFLQEDKGHVYQFNAAGRLNSVTYTYKGVAGKRTNCTYASNGLLTSFVGEGYRVEATYKGLNADINVFAETHSYDAAVDLDHADLAHTPYKNVYPFDMKCRQQLTEDGLVLKSSYYYVDSMPARECTYTYTHRGQVAQEKVVDYSREADGSDVNTVSYTYDGNGFLVMKKLRGSSKETYTYINNEHGDVTELTAERPYGTEVFTYEYEYDDQGNWTLRLCFKDGVFVNAVIRTISYFSRDNAAAETSSEESVAESEKTAKVKADKGERKPFVIDLSFGRKDKAAKAEKAEETEKADKGEKKGLKLFAKGDKPAKEEKAAKSEKPAKAKKEKAAKDEKPAKAKKEKATKDEKPAKAKKEKAAKDEKPAKAKKEKAAKAEKPAKAKGEKPAKEGKTKAKPEKKAKADKEK